MFVFLRDQNNVTNSPIYNNLPGDTSVTLPLRTGIYIYTHVYWLATKLVSAGQAFIKIAFPYIQVLISSFMTINFYSLVD